MKTNVRRFALLLTLSTGILLSGCLSTSDRAAVAGIVGSPKLAAVAGDLSKVLATIEKVEADVKTDAQSPAGQELVSAVISGVAKVAADVTTAPGGPGEIKAALDGTAALAGALNAYAGLPTTTGEVASVAKAAPGVPTVAENTAPAVAQIVTLATKKSPKAAAAIKAAAALGLWSVSSGQ